MYFNRILRVWVLDSVDYFLISALIASIAASYLKRYLSEKAAMERLKNSIINELGLLKLPDSKSTNFDSKASKIKKIYRFALDNRGGQVDVEYELAEKIKNMVTRLAAFLKQRELKGILRIIFTQGRLILELLLYTCKIQLDYIILDEVSTQVIVIAITTGGAAGFTASWLLAGTMLVTPPVIASVLLLRSFNQQIIHNVKFSKLKNMLNKLLNDEDIKETVGTILIETQKQVDNSNKIRLESFESLNWNKNPAIKEACERLGIFENTPHVTGKLNLDSLDPESTKILEELGFIKKPMGEIIQEEVKEKVKKKIKGKTVYFKDFLDQTIDYDDGMSDSGIIDAEIVEEFIRIRSNKEL